MRLLHKFILLLVLAMLAPVVVLAVSGYLSMHAIGRQAGEEASRSLVDAERNRLAESTRNRAAEMNGFLSTFQLSTRFLADGFELNRTQGRSPSRKETVDLYPEVAHPGLPGYGYVDPVHQVYADFDRRGIGCPWLPQRTVRKVLADKEFAARISRDLDNVAMLSLRFRSMKEAYGESLDLAWVVLNDGVTNAYPPYDYRKLIAEDPKILDMDESREDYVRLVDPLHNPDRGTRWLEPYLDPFKGIWMTSCVAPLYDGDEFLGSLGVDILLPVITREVHRITGNVASYAFMVAPSGRLIAVSQSGLDGLVSDPNHRLALEETFKSPTEQKFTPEMQKALATRTLAESADPAVQKLALVLSRGKGGTLEIPLGGKLSLVSFSPIGDTHWMVGFVQPISTILEPSRKVQALIEKGARANTRDYVYLTFFFLALSLLVGLSLHRTVLSPLIQLSRKMMEVSWDRLSVETPYSRRKDEVGQLYSRFREMLRMIRASRDEVTRQGEALYVANKQLTEVNLELKSEAERRRKAQEDLSREKELLDVTLHSIGDGVVATDTSGRIILLNGVAETMTGWNEAEAREKKVGEVFRIVNEESREPVPSPVEEVLDSGNMVALANHTLLISRDGTERAIADSAAPIMDAKSRIVGVVLVFRDVSERRRVEEELRNVQRLETVRLLAAGIAHDFNNLLTTVMGNLSLARLVSASTEDRERRIGHAEKAVQRAKDLTSQLLTFSSGGEPLRKPVCILDLVQESTLFSLRGTSVRAHFSLPVDLWHVLADESQLSQVINNLSINARQAMPSGGTLWVSGKNLEIRDGDNDRLAPGKYVSLTFRDEGSGIPERQRSRVFDPFYSTKPGGTGLGLAVCQSIVERHGGFLQLNDNQEPGASFTFLIPATMEHSLPRGVLREEIPHGAGRILVMDDQDSIREMAAEMLEFLGYIVDTVPDGQSALATYREAMNSGSPFDAVVLDLTIPGGMGGKEVLEALRRMDPKVAAVVSSGYSHDPVLGDYRRNGFKAAVAKPYSLPDLAEAMAQALKRNPQVN